MVTELPNIRVLFDFQNMAMKAQTRRCPTCKKSCKTPAGLRAHIKQVHDRRYECNVCEEKFAFESYLSKHKEETDCGEKAIEEFPVDEREFIHKCGNTESQFATKEDLEDHISKNHQDKESEQINYNHKFSIWLQDYLGNLSLATLLY